MTTMDETVSEISIHKSLPLSVDTREITTGLATYINLVCRDSHNARICEVVVTLDTSPRTVHRLRVKRY